MPGTSSSYASSSSELLMPRWTVLIIALYTFLFVWFFVCTLIVGVSLVKVHTNRYLYLDSCQEPLHVPREGLVLKPATTKGEFSIDTAQFLIDCVSRTKMAYCDKACPPPNGFAKVACIKPEGECALAIAYASDDSLVLAFRGSATLNDWVQDFVGARKQVQWPPHNEQQAKAHLGFVNMFKLVRHQVQALFASESRGKHVFIGGHSLGSALASLSAVELLLGPYSPNTITLYTFGAPRPGNREFASLVDSSIIDAHRVVNNADLATALPPAAFSIRRPGDTSVQDPVFEHVGSPTYFNLNRGNDILNHDWYFEGLFDKLVLLDCSVSRGSRHGTE